MADSKQIIVTQDDASKPDMNPSQWPAMRYGTNSSPRGKVRGDWSWKAYAFLGAVLAAFALFVWHQYQSWCWVNFEACDLLGNGWFWLVNIVAIALLIRGAAALAQWSHYTAQTKRGEALRGMITQDRFGNVVPLALFEGATMQTLLSLHLEQQRMAAALEAQIAPHKIYNGVNTLSEGSKSTVTTDIAAALPELPAPANPLMAPSDWLPLINDINGEPHILVSGKTNSGKSTLAEVLLAERVRRGDKIFIIDPHYQPINKYGEITWCGLKGVGGDSWESVKAALRAVYSEYDARKKAANAGNMPDGGFEPISIFVDEALETNKTIKSEWEQFQAVMGSGARKYNMFVVALSQSHLIKDIGGSEAQRENFTIVALNEKARDLVLSEERNAEKREAMLSAMQGQPWVAAMLYRGNVLPLDRSNIKTLRRERLDNATMWQPPTVNIALPINKDTARRDRIALALFQKGHTVRDVATFLRSNGYTIDNKRLSELFNKAAS